MGAARRCGLAGAIALIALLVAPTTQAAAADLVGEWHLDGKINAPDEGPETTPDSSGNGVDVGTSNGGFSGPDPDGRFGGHLPDTNVNPLLGFSEPGSPLATLQRSSMVAWVRSGTVPGDEQIVASLSSPAGDGCTSPLFSLAMGDPGDPGLRFQVQTLTDLYDSPVAPNSIWDGQWHAVTGTYDGTTARLYVDGAQVGSGTPATGQFPTPNGRPVAIDGNADPNCAPNGFDGDIDEVRIYNRALMAAEVTFLHDPVATEPPVLRKTLTVQPTGSGAGVVLSSPSGIDCRPDCSESYPSGELVFLRAEPAPGSRFAEWGGACVGAGAVPVCEVTVGDAASVQARFDLAPIGPPTPAPVSASFTAPPRVSSSSPILINASATKGATKLFWDFNGDGKSDFETDPEIPHLRITVKTPGEYDLTLRAVGAGGATSTASKIVTVGGPALKSAFPRAPDAVVAAAQAFSLPDSILKTLPCLASGLDAKEEALIFGNAEIRGCFKQVLDPAGIPASEKPQVAGGRYFEQGFLRSQVPPCQQGPRGPCKQIGVRRGFGAYVSRGPVKLNGMTLTPARGASIVVFPGLSRVLSSNATITLPTSAGPTLTMRQGAINLDLSQKNTTLLSGRPGLPLFSFDAAKSLPSIGGFKLAGQAQVALATIGSRRVTEVALRVALPGIFGTLGGGGSPPSGLVSSDADNAKALSLGRLEFSVPSAYLGGLRLSNVKFEYSADGKPERGCSSKWWSGQADIFLVPTGGKGAGLRLSPPPVRNGISFCNRPTFVSAGGEFKFDPPIPPIQVFPGVFLKSASFSMDLGDPLVFDGSIGVEALKLVRVTGGFLFAAASPKAPYVVQAGDAGGAIRGLTGATLTSTSVAVGGTVGVTLPGDNTMDLADGYLLYSYPAYISSQATARINAFAFTINAKAGFETNLTNGRFNAFVDGEACLAGGIEIAGISACFGGLVWVSSRGAVVCARIIKDGFEPGVGIRWPADIEFFLGFAGDGCKPSRFWEANVRGARKLARSSIAARTDNPAAVSRRAAPVAFKIVKGETTKNVHIDGAGGAPAVTVRGPDGETITSVPNKAQVGQRIRVLAADRYNATWIGVDDAKPGTYTVTPLPGSVAISDMSATRYEPNERLEASVTGKGAKKVLRYDVGRSPGQVIRFFERGRGGLFRELGSAKSGKGVIRFTPAPGKGGTREVVAQPTVDGMAGAVRVLDTFKAKEPKAGAVRKVRVRRQGKSLVVTWRRAANAAGYAIVAGAQNGLQKTVILNKPRLRAALKGVPATQGGTVRVAAIGPLGDWGKAGTGKFKATKKEKDRLLAFYRGKRRR